MLPSCGTKKAFQTLAEVSEKCSGTPAGTTSWFTLATPSLGIDEQPLPVERHGLDLERLVPRRGRVRTTGLAGSSVVRSDPGHAAEQDDHHAGIDQTTSSMAPENSQSGR